MRVAVENREGALLGHGRWIQRDVTMCDRCRSAQAVPAQALAINPKESRAKSKNFIRAERIA